MGFRPVRIHSVDRLQPSAGADQVSSILMEDMGAWVIHHWFFWAVLVFAAVLCIVALVLRELNKMSDEEMEILVRLPPLSSEEAQLVVNQFELSTNNREHATAPKK